MKRIFLFLSLCLVTGATYVQFSFDKLDLFSNTSAPRAWLSDAISGATKKITKPQAQLFLQIHRHSKWFQLDLQYQDHFLKLNNPYFSILGFNYKAGPLTITHSLRTFEKQTLGLSTSNRVGYYSRLFMPLSRAMTANVFYVYNLKGNFGQFFPVQVPLGELSGYFQRSVLRTGAYYNKFVKEMDYRKNINEGWTIFVFYEGEFSRSRMSLETSRSADFYALQGAFDFQALPFLNLAAQILYAEKGFNPLLSSVTYDGNLQSLFFVKSVLHFLEESFIFSLALGQKQKRDKDFYYISGFIQYRTPRILLRFFERSEQPWGNWGHIDHLEYTGFNVSYALFRNFILRFDFQKLFDGYYREKLWESKLYATTLF